MSALAEKTLSLIPATDLSLVTDSKEHFRLVVSSLAETDTLSNQKFAHTLHIHNKRLQRAIKYGFDITIAVILLLLLSPLFLLVACGVCLDGGPGIFRQQRIGRYGKSFACYKFRSMRMDADEHLERYLGQNPTAAKEWRRFQKLRNDVRITPFGHFLRRTSIDELPQLINVLKGEMSLVGPRPILPGQEQLYGNNFFYYQNVRPGITGPWQVSGRNRLPFRSRVILESSYVRNWSLLRDLAILIKTVPAVIRNSDAF